jgi:hypothetical protein
MAISSSSKGVIATILVFLYGHQLAVMATPKPYDHFTSIGKLFAARDAEAKAKSQAESAKALILSQTQDVLRKERELEQLKTDLSAYAQDLMGGGERASRGGGKGGGGGEGRGGERERGEGERGS